MDAIISKIVIGLQQAFKNDYIVTLIVSMIPTIEVRGAIPIALKMGMKPIIAYIFSCISALIIVPILMLFLKPLLNLLKKTKVFRSLANAFDDIFMGKAKKVELKAELRALEKDEKKINLYKMLGLFAFVALPLPLTGVWSGTIVAIFLNMDLRNSLLPIIVGNFVAGGIIIGASLLLGDKSYIIILILLVFVLIAVFGLILSFYKRLKEAKKADNSQQIIYSDKEETCSDEEEC